MSIGDAALREKLVDIARDLGPLIKVSRDAVEQDRRLPPRLLESLARAGLFQIIAPRLVGGFEADPITASTIFQELARLDGSVGWVALIGNGGYFTAFLDESAAREIYAGRPDLIIGSVFAPNGRAVAVPGGYRVTGRWSFASGVEHSDWMIVSCQAFDGEQPRRGDSGASEIRNVFVPAGDFRVEDTWSVGGLRGTGSHDCVVEDAFVPAERTYALGAAAVQPGPLYALPLRGFLASILASVPLGIARSAIDALVELAGQKTPFGSRTLLRDRPAVQAQVAQAEILVRSARAFLFSSLETVWETVAAGRPVSAEQRAILRSAALNATESAAKAVDLMYHAGGGSSLYTRYPLERAFRDVHAATQHAVIGSSWYESAGRVFLGMELDPLL